MSGSVEISNGSPKRGKLHGWTNTSKYKSIWHFADILFKKFPGKTSYEIFKKMEDIVSGHFPKSRFSVRTVSWYRSKFNKGIHPKL